MSSSSHLFFESHQKELLSKTAIPRPDLKPNLLKKSIFIHMPKTAGTFVREHFNEQPNWFDFLGVGHGNMKDFEEFSDLFSFTFIREPEQWLLSYWNFFQLVLTKNGAFEFQKEWSEKAVREGVEWSEWVQNTNPVEVLWNENIDVFLERVKNQAPDLIDLAYKHFTYSVDFIGKTENIIEDLLAALDLAGEDMAFYTPETIISWRDDKRNENPRKPDFQYNKSLMRDILDKNPLISSHY
jgi:hypothetical protein